MKPVDCEDAPQATGVPTVYLLGASNLTRSISTVISIAEGLLGSPLQVHVASGHGRSYGQTSSVLTRRLPGILQCALWDQTMATPDAVKVDKRSGVLPDGMTLPPPSSGRFALITDIGNDLFYGASVETILDWVSTAIQRLQERSARVVVTLLPVGTADGMSPRRFRMIRQLMFPSCQRDLDELKAMVLQLNERLRPLCEASGCAVVEQRAEWYGWDPIHIQMRCWSTAWTQILTPWTGFRKNFFRPSPSLRRWVYLRTRLPHEREFLGRQQRALQPSARLASGTSVGFY